MIKDITKAKNIDELLDAFTELQTQLTDLRAEAVKNFRKNCKHEKTTYHPDPSGNNDSDTTCDICGKVL